MSGLKSDQPASATGTAGDIVQTEDDIALSQLYSTRAFAEFLKRRPNYNPPLFLAGILKEAK